MGVKPDETRHWPTAFRGELAIHAAKKWSRYQEDLCMSSPFWEALCPGTNGPRELFEKLPRGAIVGVVTITGCELITATNAPPMPGRAFGDYTPGRYKWTASNARQLPRPVPWLGAQGFFEVPDQVVSEVQR
jgi:hypothetical protein